MIKVIFHTFIKYFYLNKLDNFEEKLNNNNKEDSEKNLVKDEEINQEIKKISTIVSNYFENLEKNGYNTDNSESSAKSNPENENNSDTKINNKSSRKGSIPDDEMMLKDFPLVVKDLSKVYENSGAFKIDNDKIQRNKALDNLNILLKNNEIFGLLG